MATLPYIQLYVSDYLADTQHLSTEEHGAYLLLIMNYWQTEKPIPNKRIQGVTRMFNDRWNSVEENIKEFFKIDENGAWYHERIKQDLEKVKEKSKKASKAGKKSALIRAKNREQSKVCLTTVEQKISDSSTIEEEREKKKEKREKNIDILKPFSFSLNKQRLLSSTSQEYKTKLEEYIYSSGKNMSYEDFYNQCEMKPYKYKNFKMAYDSWNKESKPKKSLGRSFQQIRSDEVSNKVDAVLGSGFDPFDPSNYVQESEVLDVQIEG